MALKRLAKLVLAGVGLAAAFAAGHFLHIPLPQPQPEAPPTEPPAVAKAEPKPELPKHETPPPQPPVTFAVPSVPVGVPMPISPPTPNVFPAPLFDVPPVPTAPPVPVTPLPPPSVLPVVPPTPAAPPPAPAFPSVPAVGATVPNPPAPPPAPPEPEIVEPVASVHRFDGKYLGGDARHALVYIETGDGKAEVRHRPLAATIPNADEDAKSEDKAVAVPVGKTAYHGGRAFITAPRELLVVNADCQIEWRFALPGKADSGETLLATVGFRDGKVVVVSNRPAIDGKKPLGRVYKLDVASGEATALTTVAGGFGSDVEMLSAWMEWAALSGADTSPSEKLPTIQTPSVPITHAAAVNGGLYVSTPNGVGIASQRYVSLLTGAAATAPARPDRGNRSGVLFAPVKRREEQFALVAIQKPESPEWTIPVAKAITAPPLLSGDSVYFVAGDVLYRADAKTGAVCWKLTLPLDPNDALTELTFADGGLHASGGGVLVRVTDRR